MTHDIPTRTLHDVAHAEAWRILWLSKLFPPYEKKGSARPDVTLARVRKALNRHHGNVAAAARDLNVTVETVRARLKGGW